MTSYLVLYRSPTSPQEMMASSTPEQAAAGMEAWTAWAAKAGDAVQDLGSPLADAGTKGESPSGGAGYLGGFSIMSADSASDLDALLDGHPHLMVDGNSIEYYEYLPVPGM